MKPISKVFLSFFFLTLSLAGFIQEAHAAFLLNVSPRRGGQHIRFDEARPGSLLRNEEVTLSVLTDVATQYRIYANLYQPLTNERGDVIPQGNFVVFSPSNPLGNLRTQLETPLVMGQLPIYTSNAAGDSDEFVLVFNVHVPDTQAGGTYRTQINFVAEPVSAANGATQSVVTMDVQVEIRPTFRVTILSGNGGRDLNLGRINKDRPRASQTLKFQIESNIGSSYRIVQQMTEPLISQGGKILSEEELVFLSTTAEGKGSLASSTASPVSVSPKIIYTSDDSGSSELVLLEFQFLPQELQEAGIYTGTLSFKIESNSAFAQTEVYNIPVRLEVEPTFYLDVKPEQGSQFNFGVFRTGEERQERRATLVVHSNLGEPYAVSQILTRKLTNIEGIAIPSDYFQFFVSGSQTGQLATVVPTPVKEGESIIFTSDKKGTPETFTINYSLTIPKDAKSGSYNAETVYSITTL